MGILYIIATPIGNLEDITIRALEVLKDTDFVLCEDTRITRKLLSHYNIKKPLLSYHQHSRLSKTEKIIRLLKENKNLALVSDAGTPGISDPGNELINRLLNYLKNVKIIPIPGASAVSTIASVSGIDMSKFLFLGFLPHKKGRKKIIEKIKQSEYPVIIYESKHRLLKFLEKLSGVGMQAVVGRELTKIYEEITRGSIEEVLEYFSGNLPCSAGFRKLKGEFVLIIKRGD
jgi:16S rRNA (cytidine1402-2'-O)-methyltransferase